MTREETRRGLVAAGTTTDDWLTPPDLLKALGPFDLDPCCPKKMPWRTAKSMVFLPSDGLTTHWFGRVWCNPPYSKPEPWIALMAEHKHGTLLLSAKSPDTRWGQLALRSGAAFYFLSGRLSFCHADGTPSDGKWLPNLFVAYGKADVQALTRLAKLTQPDGHLAYPGVLLGHLL